MLPYVSAKTTDTLNLYVSFIIKEPLCSTCHITVRIHVCEMTLVSGDGGGDDGGFAAGRAVKLRPPNQMLLLSYLFPCGE